MALYDNESNKDQLNHEKWQRRSYGNNIGTQYETMAKVNV